MACTPVLLPAVGADYCAPVTAWGEIPHIYLGNQGRTPFTDESVLAEWTAALDNTTVELEKIRAFNTIGNKPAGESTEVPFSLGRVLHTEKKHSIPFRIDEVGPENYAFLQFTEDNPGQTYKLWYPVGDYICGGPEGVDCNIVLNEVVPESKDELVYFEGVATFTGRSPNRVLNPNV